MGNWEYKQVYCIPSDSPNVLNELGGLGWELCSMSENIFYFKRPMKCVNCKNYNKELIYIRSNFYDIKCKDHKNLEIKEGCGCEKFKPKN